MKTVNSYYWVWLAIMATATLIMSMIPLFNLLAFEFCAVLAFVVSIASAHITINTTQEYFTKVANSPFRTIRDAFWLSLTINLTLLILPFLIIILNAFRVPNCNFIEGFLLFLLLPIISCIYGTSAGTCFRLLLKRHAFLAYLSYNFVTLLLLLHNIAFDPPVFGFHSTFGYFPGPIYDRQISITSTLLLARGTTLLISAIFFQLSILIHQKPRIHGLSSLVNFIPLTILVLGFSLIWLYKSELGLRPTRSFIEKKLGGFYQTRNFLLFFEKGSIVEDKIKEIAVDHEFRYAQLIKYFQINPDRKVRSYIYTSPKRKKRLMGAKYTSLQDVMGYGLHINFEDFPHPVLKHELAHVLTSEWHSFLPISLKLGLHEGIAVAAEWDSGDLDPHQWTRAMHDLNIAPSIQRIMGLGFWIQSGPSSYTVAGSFVRFLVDTYGIEKFKHVFPTGNFKKIYNKSLATLDREWQAFLDQVVLTDRDLRIAEYRFKRPSIFQEHCAHEVADLSEQAWSAYGRSNWHTAIDFFNQIHELDSSNPKNLRGLMLSNYQLGLRNETIKIAQQIINHPKSNIHLVAEARNIIGNLHWQNEELDEAASTFQDALSLHASDSIDRSMQAKLAALATESKTHRDRLKLVLINRPSSRLRMVLLNEVMQELPDFGLIHYLIGRQLYLDQQFSKSNQYLLQAKSLELPDNLTIENLRLIGVNGYHTDKYKLATDHFNEILKIDNLPRGKINRVKEWIERCQWNFQ
ncbi:TPA: hypothetical protein EYN23_24410 [Candidatus Poribacteria bacterium]|nr:hypothetical protein [Candidatus Poribacteria bacterium]